ncbi:MAG: 2-C-methyl-D-erythritol 4-phosphate cytidylyltransferase [Bacteroidales bacterium]|nr:2-C-methyl-D-erythritol 4-phosphate cytidylyltransferase [Candidatus Colimorpha pelethequi]
MNIAIVLAGGSGSRMNADKPKQFLDLDGKTVVEHSIDAFDRHPAIDAIAVVVHPQYKALMQEIISRRNWKKVNQLIDGGSERYLSTLNAVVAFLDMPDDTNLIFHDAARPWISQSVIDRVVDALQDHEAVGTGIPSTDTVWEVNVDFTAKKIGGHFISRIPQRERMYRAQTPQAFRLPLIRDAYQRALQDSNFRATDDCGVVRQYMPEVKIHVVEGEERNRKITFPSDLE